MATDNVHRVGFRFVGYTGGASASPAEFEYQIVDAFPWPDDAAAACTVNVGDPVKLISTGKVAVCEDGEALFGVVSQILPYWDGAVMKFSDYIPNANTGGGLIRRANRVMVILVKDAIFEIDADDATTATTEAAYQAFVGECCDGLATRATINGRYQLDPKLDISTHGTSGGQWLILGISKTAENRDFAGNYVKLLVTANEYQLTHAGNGI